MAQNIKIKQWEFKRYLFYLKYNTFQKNLNLFLAIFAWFTGRLNITSKPAFLRVEISRKCSVDCLYCSSKKEDLFYPLDSFKKLIDEFKDYLYLVSLYEIGEPLENNDIIDYIKYAKTNNVGTIISTNLSILKGDEFWKNLVLSGLDRIIVAIDGVSPKIYNMYRRNGNLELVLANLDKILILKKTYNSKIIVEWQMIDFPWNKIEQQSAREMALNMGCNEFRLIQEVTQIRRKYKDLDFVRKSNCILPYFTFNVTAYNDIRPCTKIYNEMMTIGSLNLNSTQEIWNGDAIKEIRSKKLIQNRAGCRTCRE